ncbi:MAG: cytochrome c peroxidase [Arenicella sp.]|jgi:cytochrome c peroxidase
MKIISSFPFLLFIFILTACGDDSSDSVTTWQEDYPAITSAFENSIDLDKLENYANQTVPSYISKDNTGGNVITDKGAMLGRVLFYDKRLSTDNTISCASCHQQEFAFSDTAQLSTGVNGVTGRHAMRLINSRFSDEFRFFWDERATNLEEQTTMPIQDHAEMGFSGENGDPGFSDLITKLKGTDYYSEFFTVVYGDDEITEARMQECMAQFIRSMQSFDSKFDAGRATVNAINQNFSNFTQEENLGKALFLAAPPAGAGCGGCHRNEEFDIDPNSRNNGITTIANSTARDFTITRSPTLRDIFNPSGIINGQLMHDGSLTTLEGVVNHYNRIVNVNNTNLDPRLSGRDGQGQDLQLTQVERDAIVTFLKTLGGNDIYTNSKWSDPF